MHHDMKIGLALAILLIGVVGAFFFRNEPDPYAPPPEVAVELGAASGQVEGDPLAEFEQAGTPEEGAAQPAVEPGPRVVDRAEASGSSAPAVTEEPLGGPSASGPASVREFTRSQAPLPTQPNAQRTATDRVELRPGKKTARHARRTKRPKTPTAVTAGTVEPSRVDEPLPAARPTGLPRPARTAATHNPRPAPRHNNAWEVVPDTPQEPTRRPKPLPPKGEPTAGQHVAYVKHRVQPGETLSGLARRYLGSSTRFREIFEVNRDLLRDPNDLKAGMVIRIPVPASAKSLPASGPTPPSKARRPKSAGRAAPVEPHVRDLFQPVRKPPLRPARPVPSAASPDSTAWRPR